MPKPTIFGFLILTAALYAASTAAPVEHLTPRNNLRKRNPVTPLPPPPAFIRRVPPLVWDANLTAEAHAWAVQRRGDCDYRRHSSNRHGESIYWMSYKEFTPYDVVKYWYNEYKFYDHKKNVCLCKPERPGCECGHYLNVVWSTSKRVGCSGVVYCDNQKGVYVVCQYDPAGLIPGINPFTGFKL
ncbi:hypothetical protein BUALT_BualtUnG0036500 [Buddleja alternifolia]|uniref:SCP domain-containing protein n=1 Tax=Buddleja alternifolia TaxID=168488 RepID=A0AAV6W567_9LAMI|nr:hypothetical protein BUALT_BualtUnG0036500 [Buddleja alternifolia]